MRTFLGLGAQRTATTWLFECLRSHPEIFMPDEKELQYFSSLAGGNNAQQGFDWYSRKLNLSGNQKVSGEITPEYLLDPAAPLRIKETLEHPRLFACVREPVSRAVSAYRKGLRENNWDCSLAEFLENNLDYCLDRGLYSIQLQRYLDQFPRQDIRIMVYDDIAFDPGSFIREIYQFLGVDPDFISPMVDFKFNIGVSQRREGVRAIVFLRDLVYKLLGQVGRDRIVKAIQRTKLGNRWMQGFLDPDSLNGAGDQQLLKGYREFFRDDVQKTSLLLGRDLVSLWGYDN